MITIDPQNFTINSDASILDLPALHQELRDWEDSEQGAIHPVTHTWKALDLGGGAFFYQMDLTAYYSLRFIGPGPFQISGNLNGPIVNTGVQVERKTSAAYVTTAIGASGITAADVWAFASRTLTSNPGAGMTLAQFLALKD